MALEAQPAAAVTRVLFLVDRIALAAQAEDAFTDHLRDYPCHVLRPGHGFDRAKRITIATLQTMIAEYGRLSSGYFNLVTIDECHRSIYGRWSGVLRHFDGIQLGLTATRCTAEAAREGIDPEDGHFVRDTLRFFEVERPTFRYRLRQAIAEGYLVPYRICTAMTVKTAAEGGFGVRRGELLWSAMDEATREEFEELFAASDPITVNPQALERKFRIPGRNRALVREYRTVLDDGFTGKDGGRHYSSRVKTIVFAVTNRHAETLATMFDEHFADLKPHPTTRYADFVLSDLGGGPSPDASTIIKRFKDEEFPQILVSVNMLDTGFDCPEVVNLVMARFTRSAVLYRQMRGRGTRKAPHIHKTDFTMFAFVGVVDFHGNGDDPSRTATSEIRNCRSDRHTLHAETLHSANVDATTLLLCATITMITPTFARKDMLVETIIILGLPSSRRLYIAPLDDLPATQRPLRYTIRCFDRTPHSAVMLRNTSMG